MLLLALALLLADPPPYAPTGGVSDKSVGPVTLTAACTSAAACSGSTAVVMPMAGVQSAELTFISGAAPVGFTVYCDTSYNGGVTYLLGACSFSESDQYATTRSASLASGVFIGTPAAWSLVWRGSPSNLRIRAGLWTSGAITVQVRATFSAPPIPGWVSTAGSSSVATDAAGFEVGSLPIYESTATPGFGYALKGDASGPSFAIPSSNILAPSTSEWLILASGSTPITWPSGARSCAIQNKGPNKISCNANGAATVALFDIYPATFITVDGTSTSMAELACIATTADQIHNAATVLFCVK